MIIERLESKERIGHFLTEWNKILPSQFAALELPDLKKAIKINKVGYLCKEEMQSNNSFYLVYVLNCDIEMKTNTVVDLIIKEILSSF